VTVIFACKRLSDLPQCKAAGCTGRAAAACEFPLRGKKAGQTCARPLCGSHTVTAARGGVERKLCEGHARQPWPA
jgi:hypothetical protein